MEIWTVLVAVRCRICLLSFHQTKPAAKVHFQQPPINEPKMHSMKCIIKLSASGASTQLDHQWAIYLALLFLLSRRLFNIASVGCVSGRAGIAFHRADFRINSAKRQ
jgi:hypothetical protein